MSYFRVYIEDIMNRTRRSYKNFILSVAILALIVFILNLFGLRFITGEYSPLIAFFIGLTQFIPVVGSGIVFIPWIIHSLFKGYTLYAGQLAVLFITIIIIKQLVEPYITGEYVGFRSFLSLIIFVFFYLIGGLKGCIFGAFLIYSIKVIFDMLDINKSYKKYQFQRKQKRIKVEKFVEF